MALANSLATAGFTATSVKSSADVHLGKDDKGFLINRIDLTVTAVVPKSTTPRSSSTSRRPKRAASSRAPWPPCRVNVKATLKN